ncbi:MAG: hypothetical protein ACRD1J_08335 [Terriglobia bacterium]
MRVNSFDDQRVAVQLYFARYLSVQLAVARVYAARFQRAAKSPRQSAAGSSHHII